MISKNKSIRGASSQFFVAGELCGRGLIAVPTMGNAPNTDILCGNVAGTKSVHIQVKTYVPGSKTVSVGKKAEIDNGQSFVWVLVGNPLPNSSSQLEYYIIPASEMAKNVRECYQIWITSPGKNGQRHNPTDLRTITLPPGKDLNGWNISVFKNKWSIIEDLLKD